MEIVIRAIGKEKSKEVSALSKEYLLRTNWSMQIQELELKKSVSEEEQKILEGKLLLEKLPENSYIFALDENGKQFTSIEFSNLLTDKFSNYKNIYFLVGGAFGLSQEVKKKVNLLLSFGQMTFPHKLIRVMLMEQLYRAYTITIHHPYHK